MRQLQVKKVYLTEKVAKQNRVKGTLAWKKNFVTPQVPPPSRSLSKTNIICVSVRKKTGDMNSVERTDENSHGMAPGNNKDKNTTKMEDKGLQTKTTASVQENLLRTDDNTTLENTCEEDIRLTQRLECSFRQSGQESNNEQKFGWIYDEAPDATSIQHQVLHKQLAPTVKGLKVIPKEIWRRNLLKQRSDEKSKNEKQHYDDNEHESKTQRNDSRAPCDTRRRSSDDHENLVLKDRVKTATPCLDSQISPKKGRQDFGCDQQTIVSDRQNIACNRLNIGGEQSNLRRGWENDQQNIGSDRENIESGRKNIGTNRKILTETKTIKESKNKRNGRKSRESDKNSSTKINKSKSVQKFVYRKPNIQGLGVFAKTITSGSKYKGRMEKKISKQESKKTLLKPQSAMQIKGKKSSRIELPRKSCSACTVKLSSNDESLRVSTKYFRSKSDTTAGIKVREAGVLYKADSNGSIQSRKSQSPQPIILPSQSQLQNFDKVAKNKLCKSLAVKMRRHCYTGSWAFPCAKIRKNGME